MPASMISAPTGSMPKVIGSSMVMVAIGPTPGSTPIRVPIRQPRKQRPTFLSESATLMPSDRLPTRSPVNLRKRSIAVTSAHDQVLDGEEELPDARFHAGIGVIYRVGDQAGRIEGDRQVEQLLE